MWMPAVVFVVGILKGGVAHVLEERKDPNVQTVFRTASHPADPATSNDPKEKWDYVNVHKDAYMFWWLYYTTNSKGFQNSPLILWLQGGPGASSSGFGNFQEIGPLDVHLKPRNTTWLSEASLLFVDNPVGTGFSYVTSDDAYTTDVSGIASDLLVLIKHFLNRMPQFKTVPLYIFSESYGGKMAAAFTQVLNQAINNKSVECNLKGVALGDSWISPVDSVLTWGTYLYATSLVDEIGMSEINNVAMDCQEAFRTGNFKQSTDLWRKAEDVIDKGTGGVNFYNILQWDQPQVKLTPLRYRFSSPTLAKLFRRHVLPFQNDELSELMNGPIRKKLGMIPQNVTWGGQSGEVFQKQSIDFMKPVVKIVNDLVSNTALQVVVYNGQLDLIVDTMGTELWVQQMHWSGLNNYTMSNRTPLISGGVPWGYRKKFSNFSFYWILDSGHMVPADAGEAAMNMIRRIITNT